MLLCFYERTVRTIPTKTYCGQAADVLDSHIQFRIHLTFCMIPYMVLIMNNTQFHTVLDTNILFAGLYSKKGASFKVLQAVTSGMIKPTLSVALLFEYEDVLKRNSRQLGFNYREIDSFLDNICLLGSFQKIHYLWRPFLPDPKDDHVLELAIASQVRNITTFNLKDFKGVDKFGVNIIRPKDLLEAIKWEL